MWRGLILVLMVAALCPQPGDAAPRQRIDIVAVPGAFGYASKIADAFSAPTLPAPRIEAASDAPMRFCGGIGLDTPDVLVVTRGFSREEAKRCKAEGVTPTGLVLGAEGFIVYAAHGAPRALSLRQLFLALAQDVPAGEDESLTSNPYVRWRQIDPGLPDVSIAALGPAPKSPMAEALVDMAMAPGAQSFALFRRLAREHPADFAALVRDLRQLPVYAALSKEADLAERVRSQPGLIVIAPLDSVAPAAGFRALAIDGVPPTGAGLRRGYALQRPVRLYIKAEHAAIMPGLKALLGAARRQAAPKGASGFNRLGLFAPAGAKAAAPLSKALEP